MRTFHQWLELKTEGLGVYDPRNDDPAEKAFDKKRLLISPRSISSMVRPTNSVFKAQYDEPEELPKMPQRVAPSGDQRPLPIPYRPISGEINSPLRHRLQKSDSSFQPTKQVMEPMPIASHGRPLQMDLSAFNRLPIMPKPISLPQVSPEERMHSLLIAGRYRPSRAKRKTSDDQITPESKGGLWGYKLERDFGSKFGVKHWSDLGRAIINKAGGIENAVRPKFSNKITTDILPWVDKLDYRFEDH